MTRQKILITGASSGLGAGIAREFAAKGRDLALCARRTDRLDELKSELSRRYPDVTIAVAALDVNDHDQVPKVFAELSDALGGIDRVIVNAGIGKGARLGSGKLWANKATIETIWWPRWFRSRLPWRCSTSRDSDPDPPRLQPPARQPDADRLPRRPDRGHHHRRQQRQPRHRAHLDCDCDSSTAPFAVDVSNSLSAR